MNEIYKDIKGYEGRYKISNLGNILSFGYHKVEKIIAQSMGQGGYLHVCLCKNGEKNYYRVHRLVAETFISNPNNLPIINHKDENKLNNCATNLEWCSRSYNVTYGEGIQKMIKSRNKKEAQNAEREVRQISLDGRVVAVYKSINEANRITGISRGNIWSCLHGRRDNAGGYRWLTSSRQC